jgi:Ferritin-like domain
MTCMGNADNLPAPPIPAGANLEQPFTRSQLLSRGARTGAALLAGGTALGTFAGTAKAEPLSDGDLAYARLLVGLELLSIDFYGRAVAAKQFRTPAQKRLKEALAHEQAHYQSVGQILVGAGFTPAGDGDVDYSYPAGTFRKPGTIAKFGFHLETISIGAYLGAVMGLQSNQLVQQMARIAASEAQHLSAFGSSLGRPFGFAFPAPLPIDQISVALDAFES